MSTNSVSAKDIKRNWKLIDAKDKILGKVAVEAATMLMGKNKPSYVPYLDMGDFVVVINAASVQVTGKKSSQKTYARHSGYPGGLKVETLSKLKERRPQEVIRHAVWGMVPKGKLGRQMIKKLHIFSGSTHDFENRFRGEK